MDVINTAWSVRDIHVVKIFLNCHKNKFFVIILMERSGVGEEM